MRFYDATFFIHKGTGILATMDTKKDEYFPITLRINKTGEFHSTPSLTFYFDSFRQLINFKNSLTSAFDKAMKEAGYDK